MKDEEKHLILIQQTKLELEDPKQLYIIILTNISRKEQESDRKKDCLKLIENNRSYFEITHYSVLLSSMWKKLTNTLQNSCCIAYKIYYSIYI